MKDFNIFLIHHMVALRKKGHLIFCPAIIDTTWVWAEYSFQHHGNGD
ncbi:hypothetical protein LCGC14_0725150 [marine sediment metagenome]|uniref:Uncharacterized protein n=1 Tax=marine sediment metagenome TaxID=412755 RepID=A0A0F9SWK4_9ZZZZ